MVNIAYRVTFIIIHSARLLWSQTVLALPLFRYNMSKRIVLDFKMQTITALYYKPHMPFYYNYTAWICIDENGIGMSYWEFHVKR